MKVTKPHNFLNCILLFIKKKQNEGRFYKKIKVNLKILIHYIDSYREIYIYFLIIIFYKFIIQNT